MKAIGPIYRDGFLSIENLDFIQKMNLQDCQVGLQTTRDGKIWLCVNGTALIRFKPHRKAEKKGQ